MPQQPWPPSPARGPRPREPIGTRAKHARHIGTAPPVSTSAADVCDVARHRRNVAFRVRPASLGGSTRPVPPAQTPESVRPDVRRPTRRQPPRPRRTSPTTVGWIAIILFSFLAGLGAIAAIAAIGVYARWPTGLPPPDQLENYVLPEQTIIYDRTGKIELARFGDAKREVVQFDEIPKVLLDATTAVEDKTFWDNAGLRPGRHHLGDARTRSAATAAARRPSPSSSSASGCSTRPSSRTRTGRPSASSRRSSSRSG